MLTIVHPKTCESLCKADSLGKSPYSIESNVCVFLHQNLQECKKLPFADQAQREIMGALRERLASYGQKPCGNPMLSLIVSPAFLVVDDGW